MTQNVTRGWIDSLICGAFPEILHYYDMQPIDQGYIFKRPKEEDEFALLVHTSHAWWKCLIFFDGHIRTKNAGSQQVVIRFLYDHVIKQFSKSDWIRIEGTWRRIKVNNPAGINAKEK